MVIPDSEVSSVLHKVNDFDRIDTITYEKGPKHLKHYQKR